MKGKIFFGVGVGILVFVLGISLLSAQTSEWLDGWQYRVPITIRENSGNSLGDYQVMVEINTQELISEGKMRDDCGDVRFALENGSLLSYWIESGCNSQSTRIWVKVPEIPASGTTKIYMYYGNPGAESESDGENVFDDFADFETDYDGYTMSGSYSRTTSQEVYGDYSVEIYSNMARGVKTRPFENLKYSGWINMDILTAGNSYLGFHTSGTPSGMAEIQFSKTGGINYICEGTMYSTGDTFSVDTWYKVEIRVKNNTDTYSIEFYVNDEKIGSCTVASLSQNMIFETGTEASKPTYYDLLYVAKYTSPEPTYTLGEEETSTTTTTTTTTTTISTTTTTTLPQECGEIGSSCALCDDWVELNTTKGILKVRDSDGNGKFDQVCCSGVVSEVIML